MKTLNVCHSIALDQYVVTRKVEINGRQRSRRIACTNPAWGLARLDYWKATERALADDAALRELLDEQPLQRAKIRKRLRVKLKRD